MASGTRAETVSTWPTGDTAQRRVSGTLPLRTNSLGNRDRAEPGDTGHTGGEGPQVGTGQRGSPRIQP